MIDPKQHKTWGEPYPGVLSAGTRPVRNGTTYDCWICGCKPGEPHGAPLPAPAAAASDATSDDEALD